jgi:hypothetical protein
MIGSDNHDSGKLPMTAFTPATELISLPGERDRAAIRTRRAAAFEQHQAAGRYFAGPTDPPDMPNATASATGDHHGRGPSFMAMAPVDIRGGDGVPRLNIEGWTSEVLTCAPTGHIDEVKRLNLKG